MAKSSVPRHSKSARKPVTIELEPASATKTTPGAANVPEPEPVGFEPVSAAKTEVAQADVTSSAPSDEPALSRSSAQPGSFGREQSSDGRKPGESATVPPLQKSNDALGRLASGLVGGVVALVGAAALQWAGVLPSPKADVSALEQQIAALRNAPVQTLDEGAQVALNGAVENAKQAVGQVGALSDEISSIKQSIAEVEKKAQAGTGGAVDTSAIDARIAALEAQLSASQEKVDQAGGVAAGATTRLDALESKVHDASSQTNMALAMAATGLKAAVDRGEPFAAELDTYLAVAPEAGEIESLRAYATKGVSTVSALAKQFDDVAPRIIAATRDNDPNAGVLDGYGQVLKAL
ncbi:hypothetical protein BLM14_19435 [Phyllobacterium zundukense]|uniref:COG4223 family protein n=1 Tax=Phyllobacterium zundukense TaxID=1867719 RepID=UPI000C1BBF13|nr:hypothetical protein [Phyllobacterium zundukense]ATU93539.1 hypothetical protein BLM14_19435 [Phyllobacterium zundukense]